MSHFLEDLPHLWHGNLMKLMLTVALLSILAVSDIKAQTGPAIIQAQDKRVCNQTYKRRHQSECQACTFSGSECYPGSVSVLLQHCPKVGNGFKTCRVTCEEKYTEKCCLGFWGDDCSQECPGGSLNPCNGHGKCASKNGQCLCEAGFEGTACERCTNATQIWPDCSLEAGVIIPTQAERFCKQTYKRNYQTGCRSCSYFGSPCRAGYKDGAYQFNCAGVKGQCNYVCEEDYSPEYCCHGFWGDGCIQECPGGSGNPCNGHGECSRKNGQCYCEPGFEGKACELCTNVNKYGPNCSLDCNCEDGACNNGINGDGFCKQCPGGSENPCNGHGYCFKEEGRCLCEPGLEGKACELCTNVNKYGPDCSLDCKCEDGECNNGIHGDGLCKPKNPCQSAVSPCGNNSRCIHTGPGKHACVCDYGYAEEGAECVLINPCLKNKGGCDDTTECVYIAPYQSTCQCKAGYEGYIPGQGCDVQDLCRYGGGCWPNSVCATIRPYTIRCTCKEGYTESAVNVCVENIKQETAMDLIKNQSDYSTMYSMIMAAGLSELFSRPNTTVLITNNKAWDYPSLLENYYLKNDEDGRRKLEVILKNHVFPGVTDVTELTSKRSMKSYANVDVEVTQSDQGQVRLDGDVSITKANMSVKTGLCHRVDKVLVPSYLMPLVNNVCDVEETQNIQRKTCCKGFYGPSCLPCPGGSSNPCSGHGQCSDGDTGTGVCSCHKNFIGTTCDRCANNNTFGPECNEPCTCKFGQCDSGSKGTGKCRPGTCQFGYNGENCDNKMSPCFSDDFCPLKAKCFLEENLPSCHCPAGYEDSGKKCTKIDLCSEKRNPCHQQATCSQVWPNVTTCTCNTGWHGDGFSCMPNQPCDGNFDCHPSAVCQDLEPSQDRCVCNAGYSGNGMVCKQAGPCLELSGNCHPEAKCTVTKEGKRKCTCPEYLVGDGITCRERTIAEEILENPELATLGRIMKVVKDYKNILGLVNGSYTFFAPDNRSIMKKFKKHKNSLEYWSQEDNALSFLKFHTIRHAFSREELTTSDGIIQSYPTLYDGYSLHIEKVKRNMHIYTSHSKPALIRSRSISAVNGVIHMINQVLAPLRPENQEPSFKTLLLRQPKYKLFYKALEETNVLETLSSLEEYTLFVLPNDVVKQLKMNITTDFLKYHILPQRVSSHGMLGKTKKKTILGSQYRLSAKRLGRKTYVNEVEITRPNMWTDVGVVHEVSEFLRPVKSRCDENNDATAVKPECCGGYYGPACLMHSGTSAFQAVEGLSSLCSGNGVWWFFSDLGVGICRCNPGFHGVRCKDADIALP